MITGILITIVATVFTFIVSLLPTIPLPTGITDALTLIWSYINMFSFLFPVDTLLTVLVLALLYHIIFLFWDMGLWIIGVIRG